MPSTAVRARGPTTTFGEVIALDAVDLDVGTGENHRLVGPDGAGKTTLLGILLGVLLGPAAADRGTLDIRRTPVGGVPPRPGGRPVHVRP